MINLSYHSISMLYPKREGIKNGSIPPFFFSDLKNVPLLHQRCSHCRLLLGFAFDGLAWAHQPHMCAGKEKRWPVAITSQRLLKT